MKPFQIEETEKRTTAWIYPEIDGDFDPVHGEPEPERVAVQLRYVTPRQREAYRRKLLQRGILKRKVRRGEEFFDDVPGREADRDVLFVETFIAGWNGVLDKDKQPLPFTAEQMAELMSSTVWLNKSISKALEEMDSFFGSNGSASSAS
jgi:hypothetical protein